MEPLLQPPPSARPDPRTLSVERVAPGRPRLGTSGTTGDAPVRHRGRDLATSLGGLTIAAWVAVQVLASRPGDFVLASDGPPAPIVEFTTLDGRIVRTGPSGGAPLVLLFVSTWCPSCAAEAAAWNAALAANPAVGVFIIDIDPLDTPESLAGFRDDYGLRNLRFVLDAGQALARGFGFPGMDATIALSAEGRIVYTDQGPTSGATIATLIAALR